MNKKIKLILINLNIIFIIKNMFLIYVFHNNIIYYYYIIIIFNKIIN